ncbi:MAG TPA: purine-nucleoside phosphorylase, partial [bacterium]|nr:purine-nucleoside phosphorylase [bacterium]
VVLGSGLSDVLRMEDAASVPYGEIPSFPRGSLAGHDRRLESGTVGGRPVVVLRGRAHFYEGFDLVDATFPVRVARALGAPWIALVNAAGGLDPEHRVGDLVLIRDHLNLMGDNPLIGENDDSLGPRFPDLSRAYDAGLLERAEAAAAAANVKTRRGVYAAVAGPTYETPAELKMIQAVGADLVGMSTVPETIVAVHGGMRVLGISVVTDLAANPDELEPLSHEQVVRAAQEAGAGVDAVLRGVIEGESA